MPESIKTMKMKKSYSLKLWERLNWLPGGGWMYTKLVTFKVPYFRGMRPRITHVSPERVEVKFKKRKSVMNHIGTVHVLATCNAMEMAMGVLSEASVPLNLRWIPKGMEVEYLVKGETDLTAIAEIDPKDWQPGDIYVPVKAVDTKGRTVISGKIKVWITEKKPKVA